MCPQNRITPRYGTWNGRVCKVAMTLVGHRTEAMYRRYDIVTDGDLHDAAIRINSAATVTKTVTVDRPIGRWLGQLTEERKSLANRGKEVVDQRGVEPLTS